MGEFFELAFFSPRDSFVSSVSDNIQTALSLHVGQNTVITNSFKLLERRNVWFDIIEGDEFVEHLIAVENLHITNSRLDEILDQICTLVDRCFYVAPEMRFATGIYELTGYYLRDACNLDDIQKRLFPSAPFIFSRSKLDCGFSTVKYSSKLYYTLQQGENIQSIF